MWSQEANNNNNKKQTKHPESKQVNKQTKIKGEN